MQPLKSIELFKDQTFALSPVTVSKPYYCGNAKRVGLLVKVVNHSSGHTAFTTEVSYDLDTNAGTYFSLNVWINNLADTNAQNLTRSNGITLSANGTDIIWLDAGKEFPGWIRVTGTTTTDGTASAWLILDI